MSPLVILGSGLAGYGLLREFRKRDATTPVTLITADDGRVYSKPNLSNALSQGRAPAQLASETAAQAAAKFNTTILTHTRVSGIDPAGNRLITDGGEIPYSRLVLALGADPFPHGLSGDAAQDVLSVNDLDDYTRFRAALEGKHKVAILGGGLIGCEFANDLAAGGHAVTVVHLGPWPLERLIPEPMGQTLAQTLEAKGVAWRFGHTAKQVDATGNGYRLTLDDGSQVEADLVLSAIGLRSRTQLAKAAGIPVNRGIVVNRKLETGVAGIYAVGDCAEVAGHVLPFVQPLLIQVRALAAILTGENVQVSYPVMPVMVKTSAWPIAVQPPAPSATGDWHLEQSEKGIVARHLDEAGSLNGFALGGAETARRAELAKQVEALLA
ncbi:MAG: FAD-dependent oxidoreductase [Pseudomonadota bacterium]|jgi:rubredoxin-NAD+ reductase|nr:FAD-dependent oxidoreductase [Pseudomonadota bacterium]MDP1906367.1 FAD-dependent oxidoreductase [Pseudomonadota bacterium]MDP2351498.1 FAD-dependent oxidoreductase [Pseudomonadota bacterium]